MQRQPVSQDRRSLFPDAATPPGPSQASPDAFNGRHCHNRSHLNNGGGTSRRNQNNNAKKNARTKFRNERSRKFQNPNSGKGKGSVSKKHQEPGQAYLQALDASRLSPSKQHLRCSNGIDRKDTVVNKLLQSRRKDPSKPKPDNPIAVCGNTLLRDDAVLGDFAGEGHQTGPDMGYVEQGPKRLHEHLKPLQDEEMRYVAQDLAGAIYDQAACNSSGGDGAVVAVASKSSDDEAMDEGCPPVKEYTQAEVEGLYSRLGEFLQVEVKFQPTLVLPGNPQRGEISAGTRDGAAHVLRCLKVWYDLPTDVLFHAINLLDRFLTKMKVRQCHISCISVSCMNIAISSHRPQLSPINTEDLVSISQCKCTVGDVRRMSAVIEEKLGSPVPQASPVVTPLHWMRLQHQLMTWAATGLGVEDLLGNILPESEMVNRLEILSCDASCCSIRACELALALLCTQLDSQLTSMQRSSSTESSVSAERLANLMRLVDFAMDLQRICQIGDESFFATHQAVVGVLERYNARQKTPHRQRLVWRLSSRTLKVLRPTDRLTSTLPTILEQQNLSSTSGLHSDANRSRSGSECSDEDTKDWPTSPLVPVLCNDH